MSIPIVPSLITGSASPSAQNVNYPVTVLTKPSNGKGNRKQQQQQQQQNKAATSSNASSFIVMTSPRKNGKINQKNQLGKNGKQRQTTPRPLTTLYFNKDRKYEFINGVMSVNRPSVQSTTVRPIKLPNNNVDNKSEKMVYIKSPIKSPKQVKENVSMKTTAIATALKTTSSATTTTTSTATLAHVELIDSFQYTSNPNIPKLFQKYEKIQEFYPEFHPYVGGQKSPTRYPVGSGSGTGNGKPSRDGSKSNYFTSTNQQQSSFPSSLSISSSGFATGSATSKLLSTALLGTAAKKNSQSSAVVSTKNGKG